MTRWIRKASLVAAAAAALLLGMFLLAFKDPLLRWGLERAGRTAARAKVRIAAVRSSLGGGRLTLRKVAIADKNAAMRDVVDCDEASFQLSPAEALRAKIVIPEARLTGLRFAAPRRRSGALLLPGRPTAPELAVRAQLGAPAAPGAPADADEVSRRLFGPQAAAKLVTPFYWIAWMRSRGAAEPRSGAQRRGVNVEFPLSDSKPQFLLERAELSGSLPPLVAGPELSLEGLAVGVNSNPPQYGKPTTLSLRASAPGGASFELRGLLDLRKKPGELELTFQYAGAPLEGLRLGDDELGAVVSSGTARVDGTLRVTGTQWKGAFVVEASGVVLEPKVGFDGPRAARALRVLSRARAFEARISVEGPEGALRLRVDSDLGRALAQP